MPRKNSLAFDVDEAEAVRLSRSLSGVVSYLLFRLGYTQAHFAREMGISRTTLNTILNSTERKNLWRLPTLVSAARVLHVSVADLFLAILPGTSEDDDPLQPLVGKALLGSTDQGTPERLARLIVRSLSLFPDDREEKLLEKKNFEAICGCRRVELERGCPRFYGAYVSGVLTDADASKVIGKALSYVRENGGIGVVPIWVALQKVF